ncbi:MAG: MarR family transcriptional regulator [Acidimicrobiales bacterium]|nr:MAG: MarR family transcriptional regulator [Acidimicrobiales bacterium]
MVIEYENRLLSFIKRAEQASQAAKERAVRTEGVTTAQYNVLLVLSHSPGITSSELARRCSVTAQTMSSVLARLIDRGLVARAQHPRHGAVLEISVTHVGQAVLSRADKRVLALEDAFTHTLDPAEGEQLRRLLTRCIAAADAATIFAEPIVSGVSTATSSSSSPG